MTDSLELPGTCPCAGRERVAFSWWERKVERKQLPGAHHREQGAPEVPRRLCVETDEPAVDVTLEM